MSVALVAFSGSARRDSHNRKAVEIAAEGARKAGAAVRMLSLLDFDLPLYDADKEEAEGLPQSVAALRNICIAADGYLIAAPEYNGSLPALLKNAIDWISRPDTAL